ncbi:MAG TPA: (Fe-S)-binding protein, partial [Pseudolabrys sp.]|nr:(Fe-S)-binding protein [Pseudolabrys sp.]
MTELTFEAALSARTNDMIDACTRCGKCVEACPVTGPAGVGAAAPVDVISGVIDLLRGGEGTTAASAWAKGCVGTGDCIEACPEGINPRFLLAMTRIALNGKAVELRDRRRKGIENFRLVADGVRVLSRIQLDDDELARLGQAVATRLENGSTAKEG